MKYQAVIYSARVAAAGWWKFVNGGKKWSMQKSSSKLKLGRNRALGTFLWPAINPELAKNPDKNWSSAAAAADDPKFQFCNGKCKERCDRDAAVRPQHDRGLPREGGREVHLPRLLPRPDHEAGKQATSTKGADWDTARRQGKQKKARNYLWILRQLLL